MDAITSIARIVIFLLNGFLSGEPAWLAEPKPVEPPAATQPAPAATSEKSVERDCTVRNETRELARKVARALRKAAEVVQ